MIVNAFKEQDGKMWYITRFAYGSKPFTVYERHGVYKVGEQITIERVLLDQNKTNIPDPVYFDAAGNQYKDNQLFNGMIEAKAYCIRKNNS